MPRQDETGRAADQVVRSIADQIRSGELADGQPLPPERDLMEAFGISRTVVREAVRTLSSRGLIEALPRHRPVVRKPGFDSAIDAVGSIVTHLLGEPGGVKNLFDTRIMVEASLVRQAAKEASKEDIAALTEALEANGASILDSEAFYRTDNAFHGVLYQIPQNPVLPAIHRAYTTWLAPQWSQMPRLPDRNRTNFDAHKAIYDAILMRDPDTAETHLRDHLATAWAQVRETFGDV
ncbi:MULTISPECIES: FadR/GntR family transcriptional regulator [unclassified Mameliella]|uniref:FadR/GntR family transcriptional regulator n=1 Tax=unclassified Mameliella TaxID=2630630 RepID=UPI00273FD370|nr:MULTISPECIES: FadR/GntR family transcriptional regulator [unclassified Mameliella]